MQQQQPTQAPTIQEPTVTARASTNKPSPWANPYLIKLINKNWNVKDL